MEEIKKFLKNISLFCIIGILLAFIIIANIIFIYNQCLKSFYLNNRITTVVLGDSHTQCAIDDSLFENIVNLSSNSEVYFYNFNKLKAIIQRNHLIKTVIIGCSYHSFSSFNDEALFDIEITDYTYPLYFLALDNESKMFLIKNNLAGVIFSFRNIMNTAIVSLFNYNSSKIFFNGIGKRVLPSIFRNKTMLTFWSGFHNSKKNNINDSTIAIAIKSHYFKNDNTLRQYSHLQVYYLNRIINYCIEKNMRIFILMTPLNDKYYSKIPAQFISHYYSTLNNLKIKKNVIVLDYHDYQLPDECFGDGDHLNKKGADNFTYFLNRTLMSAGISKPNGNSLH
jgi:hypothetical protein